MTALTQTKDPQLIHGNISIPADLSAARAVCHTLAVRSSQWTWLPAQIDGGCHCPSFTPLCFHEA
ncbi:hypothetical protein LNP74_23955 [Klebsiella pneumoniae subsp. pneumoniae]|nr:hypothetical protein [Klebsiella pneumoniae subsp. pneumoniae]